MTAPGAPVRRFAAGARLPERRANSRNDRPKTLHFRRHFPVNFLAPELRKLGLENQRKSRLFLPNVPKTLFKPLSNNVVIQASEAVDVGEVDPAGSTKS